MFLLTGGRKQEVLGLRRVDLAWSDELVRFVAYEGRTLKRGDGRAVPLWPQLGEILRAYLRATEAHVSGLLFPSPVPHRREPRWRIGNLRKALEWALKRAGIDKPVTLHTLRHTYTAARLQTYHVGPRGELVQVGVYQVARELGHRSSAMVEQIYGHVAPRPERLQPEVRYPISRGERAKVDEFVTTGVTATPLPVERLVAKL